MLTAGCIAVAATELARKQTSLSSRIKFEGVTMTDKLLDSLLNDGVITKDQSDETQLLARSLGIRFAEALVNLGYLKSEEIAKLPAAVLGFETVALSGLEIPLNVRQLVPASIAREKMVMPVRLDGSVLIVAVADPTRFDFAGMLQFILNRDVEIVIASEKEIESTIQRYYREEDECLTESVSDFF